MFFMRTIVLFCFATLLPADMGRATPVIEQDSSVKSLIDITTIKVKKRVTSLTQSYLKEIYAEDDSLDLDQKQQAQLKTVLVVPQLTRSWPKEVKSVRVRVDIAGGLAVEPYLKGLRDKILNYYRQHGYRTKITADSHQPLFSITSNLVSVPSVLLGKWLTPTAMIILWGLVLFLISLRLKRNRGLRKSSELVIESEKKRPEKLNEVSLKKTVVAIPEAIVQPAVTAFHALVSPLQADPADPAAIAAEAAVATACELPMNPAPISSEVPLKPSRKAPLAPVAPEEKKKALDPAIEPAIDQAVDETIDQAADEAMDPAVMRLREIFWSLSLGDALSELANLPEKSRLQAMESLKLNPAIRKQLAEHLEKMN